MLVSRGDVFPFFHEVDSDVVIDYVTTNKYGGWLPFHSGANHPAALTDELQA